MATNTNYVLVGAGTVSISAYVANAGAGTFTDMGHTKAPVELGFEFENYDVQSERAIGIIKTVPTNMQGTLKVHAMEATAENLRIALRQATGQKSGTGDNLTLAIADSQEQYHQIKVEGPGPGTNKLRTWLFWKCQVMSVEPVQVAKAGEQVYAITFRVLRDDSVTTPATNGYYGKQVDS